VADELGREMLHLLRQQLVALLGDARQAAEDAAGLSALPAAGSEWDGTPLKGRLLAPLAPVVPDATLGPLVLKGLDALSGSGGGIEADVRGWEPAPPGPSPERGIAYAVRVATPGGRLAAALALTAPGGSPRLELIAGGSVSDAQAVNFGGGWTLNLDGHATGALTVALGRDGDPTVSGATDGDALRLHLTRTAPQPGTGPGIDLGALDFTASLKLGPDLKPVPEGRLRISGGSVRIAPGDLAALLPALGPLPLDVDLAFDEKRGASIAGSTTLKVRLPTSATLPGIAVGPLDVELKPGVGPGGLSVQVHVTSSFALELPGLPLDLDLSGLGISLPFSLGDRGGLGFALDALEKVLPTGAGVDLSLPVLSGAGKVEQHGEGQYAGMLAIELPPLSVNAYGLLDTKPLSFVAVLGATFPPPGVQIGFGFAITGVGGIVGVNRRVDQAALTKAVTDGTAAGLLFPTDPAAQGDAVIDALPGIFPPAEGRVVAGPMFQISWGGRLVTASAALIIELPDPVRLSLLGKLVVAAPDPELPIVFIQVTFLGTVDTGEPSLSFIASLAGSNIAGIPITGELLLLTRGGHDPTFVLSAGGFHPRYVRPAGVPALQRIGLDLSPAPFIDLRCQAYLAITTNTVQFGARLDLVAEIAGCGLRGFLGLDVLVELDPLHFIAEVSAGISIEVLGETLAGIHLDLALEGPAPWRARGRGSIDLFFFSASLDFDETWGSPPSRQLPPPDIGGVLVSAIAKPASWTLRAPDLAGSQVQLTEAAARALATGAKLHPHGALTFRQRSVPLGIDLARFNRQPLTRPERWDVGSPTLGGPVQNPGEVREQFAPGQFLALTDDEQLGRPSFESFRAGLDLVAGSVVPAEGRDADLDYETKTILDEDRSEKVLVDRSGILRAAEAVALAATIDHPMWWERPTERVTVATEPKLAAADGWSLAPTGVGAEALSATELHQAVAAAIADDPRRELVVVEPWELTT
jgi:uncharacterized protein DUF6603